MQMQTPLTPRVPGHTRQDEFFWVSNLVQYLARRRTPTSYAYFTDYIHVIYYFALLLYLNISTCLLDKPMSAIWECHVVKATLHALM